MKKTLLTFLSLSFSVLSFSQTTLLAQYDFTAALGTDLSGNGYNGTLYGSTVSDYDRYGSGGKSLRFYGPSDYVQTTCPGVSGNGNRTISFWAKVPNGAADGGGLNYGGGPLGGDFNLYFSNSAGNEGLTLDMSDMAVTEGMYTPDNAWHQYVVTYDNVDGNTITAVKFYRDGILINNVINPYNPNGHSVNTYTTTQVKIGGGDLNMDDVRLFSGAMTATQVDSIYNAEVPPNPYLLAKYDFSGNANDALNAHNGTVYGATLTTDRFGNPNKAYDFNGTTDYIDIPSGISLGLSDFTLGFWTKHNSTDANLHVVLSQGNNIWDGGLYTGLTGTLGGQNFGCDFVSDGVYAPSGAADSLTWNQWYATYKYSTKQINIYSNGVLVQTGTTLGGNPNSGPFSIGRTAWSTNYFNGKIDEVKIFNTELNSTQVDSIYQLEKIPACGLIATIGSSIDVTCFGGSNGQATCAVTGAVGPVTYAWSNASTSATITGLSQGTYIVIATDGIGCTSQTHATINEPLQLTISLTRYPVTCNGDCNGALYASYTGGIGVPTFNWSPTATMGQALNGQCAGTYTCTATDANGCISGAVDTITQAPVMTISASVTDITCFGYNNGTATANATGGNPPYNYSWTEAQSQTVFNLSPGKHIYTIIDANNCTKSDSAFIVEPAMLALNFTTVPSSCGTANGSITANVTGGTMPYQYFWGDGSSAATLNGISSGQYYASITDTNGCSVYKTGIVNDVSGPIISLNSTTNVTCNGGSNGALSTTITGGSGPLSIQWYTGDTTSTISNLYAGTYDLVVKDTLGCSTFATYTITQPSAFNNSTIATSPSQCGFTDGSLVVYPSGATPPYTILWDAAAGNQTADSAANLSAGVYKLLVTDANGCIDSSYQTLNDPTPLYISIDSVFQAGCVSGTNNGNGSIYISVYNGTGPYTYQWSNGDTNEDVTNLGKGIFGVTVIDQSSNCKASASQFIYGIRPGTPQICLVTVDTATNHNIIVWEKDIPGVAAYTIFRESSIQGQFNRIASIPADSLSTFEDTLANAGIKPWDYEIRVVDSCGATSLISLTHQSIFLTIAQGSGSTVDLDWTPYVGTPFSAYYIYRRTNTNPWVLIDSTSSSITNYNDALAPSPIDSIDYLIEIEPTNPCNPSRAAINTSRSNIKNTSRLVNPTGVKETAVEAKALVFPNPAQSELNIKIDRKGKFNVQVYDIAGRQVMINNPELSAQNNAKLNIAELESGVYILKLVFTDGKVYRTKFVKQ